MGWSIAGVAAAALAGVVAGACASVKPGGAASGQGGGGGGVIATGGGTGSGGPTACVNLRCQQTTCARAGCTVPACAGGARTSVSGTVYDPAGKVPLYGVTVYVPNAPLAPVAEGVTCLACTAPSGDPIATATTDSAGRFKLDDVPVGAAIPLVIQVGKWRRETTIANVAACVDNPVADRNTTRLPRNKTEGHLPRIALTTGGLDALECLLRKVGIDDTEFTPESGTGRVNLFAGGNPADRSGVGTNRYASTLNGGVAFTTATGWWDDLQNLLKYDILLHACDGLPNPASGVKGPAALQAFQSYTYAGGRAFLSHWQNYWVERGPAPFPTVASFDDFPDLPVPFTATIDTTFPKGLALAEWLVNVGGSATIGSVVIQGAQHTIATVGPVAQRWIYSTDPASTQYLSFNTPIAPAAGQPQCGKVVVSDIHVSSGSGNAATDDVSAPEVPFPTGCRTRDLSPQEQVLEFMLFDLSACSPPGIP
jgi:hypothetical protein